MFYSAIFVFLQLFLTVFASERHLLFILGSEAKLECSSSFAPPWTKAGVSPGDFHIIGFNGKRHPNWKEERYSFTSEGAKFVLTISDFQLKDAGKFVCGSDSPVTFLVTALR